MCGGDGGEGGGGGDIGWCSGELLDDVTEIRRVCLNEHGVWVGGIARRLLVLVAHGG